MTAAEARRLHPDPPLRSEQYAVAVKRALALCVELDEVFDGEFERPAGWTYAAWASRASAAIRELLRYGSPT